MKEKKIKEEKIHLRKHTEFQFAHFTNLQNTIMALSMSGYFVNVIKSSETYILQVYKR